MVSRLMLGIVVAIMLSVTSVHAGDTGPNGACCFPDGQCFDGPQSNCDDAGGLFLPNFQCVQVICQDYFGGCCLPDGNCFEGPDLDCLEAGGEFFPQVPCPQVKCGIEVEACCLSDGQCIEIDPKECRRLGGVLAGPSCLNAQCPEIGACCFQDGSCFEALSSECAEQGGVFQGGGTPCAPTLCEPPADACCLPDGSCVQAPEGLCLELGGTSQGPGSACFLLDCPLVCGHPQSGDCFDLNGTGSPGCDDSECCALVCSIDPFCCNGVWDDVCAMEAAVNCTQPQAPCPADINEDGQISFPDLVLVLSAWGPYGPCPPYLPADIDRDCVVGFSDLVIVLSEWGPCIPDGTGACCVEAGVCNDGVAEFECDAGGGTYGGTGSSCEDTTCNNACVVVAVGPACICKNRTRIYAAAGAPPGGTYAWAITAGGGRAAIVGGAGAQTVNVQGTNVSAAADDVTLQVTYTVGNKVCTNTVKLTVIEATLAFRAAGAWDANNAVPQAATRGHPTLGAITPGAPAGATWFVKNIEIKGTILPNVAGLRCKFDFKRDRQGRSGMIPAAGGAIVPDALDCPMPAWCDDDAWNGDEDLVLDPPPANTIFVIDSPGTNAGAGCGAGNVGEICLVSLNFREWLEVDGGRCTDNLNWHASTRIRCAALGGGMFGWVADAGGAGNAVGLGHIAVPLAPTAPTDPDGESFSPEALAARLASPETAERLGGQNQLLDLVESGELTPRDRGALVPMLIALAQSDADDPLPMWSTQMLALRLLSVLGAEEGLPVVLDRITVEYPRMQGGDAQQAMTVAANALARYGAPAVSPIVDRAANASDGEWAMFERALRMMDDQFTVRETLGARLAATTDDVVEVRVKHALERFAR